MKIVALLQARMGSVRLPNKVMLPIMGVPLIELMLSRLAKVKEIDQIVVATGTGKENDPLAEHVKNIGFNVFRGSEDDVLARFYEASLKFKADAYIRVTGDCPLIDPQLVSDVINKYKESNVDYISNAINPKYPDGLDTEIFSAAALKRSFEEAEERYEREHVTPYIRESGKFKCVSVEGEIDYSENRWTVDEPADFKLIEKIFEHFGKGNLFSWNDVLRFKNENPKVFLINEHIKRNEGATMNTGQKLWKRAKKVIPGGNMLFSKRPELYLPEHWPTYFSKANGCNVWDLDGNSYIDMSIMGIGTNILGYCKKEVDEAVTQTVGQGNMSTLNCPEEVYLAEKLVELHPWSDMVRFARSGGEANAIAIRIARASTGKDNVAICGYHGWHDWYLSANLGDDSHLDGHHLPGLDPRGVPRGLRGTVHTFEYNNYEALKEIVEAKNIGVIKMEVQRNHEPDNGFLVKVRQLATEKNIVLIFDECTSGFRETLGGLHLKYGVEPDIAMFGKAMGNGYAITAIIGRREIMEAAQSTFISSTFWTERIGPTAALATISEMDKLKSWEYITQKGKLIKKRWQEMGESYGLKISHWGIPALAGFTIESNNSNEYKTYITQQMLSKGYLASNSVYVSTAHTEKIINDYFDHLSDIFETIANCETRGDNIIKLLKSSPAHTGFKRLN